MLPLFLILLYSALLTWLLFRITRADRPYLPDTIVAAGFGVKILFGLLYGFLFMHFYNGDDTWRYHEASLVEYHKLLNDPAAFLKDTFTSTPGRMSIEAAYSTTNSFWSDFEEVLFIRMLVLFDVLSFGHYYVNVVFFCFVGFIGQLLLLRLFVRRNRESFLPLAAVIFFYPVVLFWLSGIRKEGLLLLGMAGGLYYFDKMLRGAGNRTRNAILFILSVAMLWFIRNLVLLCMAPSLAAWLLHNRSGMRKRYAFALVYVVSAAVFFGSRYIPGVPDLAMKVTERQYSFLELNGNTRLPLDSLHGDLRSFLHVMPQALNHTFVQPAIGESKSVLQVVSAMDVFLFFLCAGVAIFFRKPQWRRALSDPLLITSFCIAVSGYLIIGYIVPFPGAFVRYKSLFELLFLACFMSLTSVTPSVRLEKIIYRKTPSA